MTRIEPQDLLQLKKPLPDIETVKEILRDATILVSKLSRAGGRCFLGSCIDRGGVDDKIVGSQQSGKWTLGNTISQVSDSEDINLEVFDLLRENLQWIGLEYFIGRIAVVATKCEDKTVTSCKPLLKEANSVIGDCS
ncbi:hypothetical protein HK104_007839 [Borealophlyctis nickersoniae]|nr:hypothetical protein HK104_007839 [Borealophlyctis nickersoniae]